MDKTARVIVIVTVLQSVIGLVFYLLVLADKDDCLKIGLPLLFAFLAWLLTKIIARTGLFAMSSILLWGILFLALIAVDLFRVLEGISPTITQTSDILLFVVCSFPIVVCVPVGLAVYRYFVSKTISNDSQTNKRHRHSILSRIIHAPLTRACALLTTALVLMTLYAMTLLVGGIYTYGISSLPDNKNPSGLTLPALAVQAEWFMNYDRSHNSEVPVMKPWSIFHIIQFGIKGYGAFSGGGSLAAETAWVLLKRRTEIVDEQKPRWLRATQPVAMWISRNWTAEQAVRTTLAESYYGSGFYGFAEASRGYFGCLPSELTAEEIEVLIGLRSRSTFNRLDRLSEREKRLEWVHSQFIRVTQFVRAKGNTGPSIELPSRFKADPRHDCKAASDERTIGELLRTSDTRESAAKVFSSIEYYLTEGLDISARDRLCRTALMQATCSGHQEVVELLLDKGADINAVNDLGWTALMAASYRNRFACAKLLLSRGADVNVKDKWGETALVLAYSNGNTRIVELLKAHGAKE